MNENVNNELRKDKQIKVISKDLLYQEAVIEFIKENEDIDFLLLNENLPGEKIKDFIKKIENIKIILFVEKPIKNKEIFEEKGVYKIFTNGEKTVEEIIGIIKQENRVEELENEIEILKEMIKRNQRKEEENILKTYINKLKKNIEKCGETHKKQENKIISIAGSFGVGKSVFSASLAKQLESKKIKTLLIDFDILNKSIHTLFGIKNIENKDSNIENHIIKKYKYLHLLCATNILFRMNNEINIVELEKILYKLKEKYDYIIIDTSSECFFNFTQKILQKTDYIIFLVEGTILEIKKSQKLLEIYTKNWKIPKEKIEIVLNKTNKYTINKKEVNKILYKTKVIGSIAYKEEQPLEIKSINHPQIKYDKKEINNIINKMEEKQWS